MIDIRDFRVEKSGRAICAVARLQVAAGERVAVVGPNGAGKTTLLRTLAGLEPGWSGRVSVEAPLRERVYVHQAPYLFRGTVLSNVAYGLRRHGAGRRGASEVARQWLRRLGLERLADNPAVSLSGGERRRAALARALALGPRLLLLDEPLADLDADGAAALAAALDELPQCTVLVASPTAVDGGFTSRDFHLPPSGS